MTPELAIVFRVLDMIGVVVNGGLGGMIARRKRFDVVGFAVLAVISALGGGLIRDTLLQAGLPLAVADPAYLTGALAGAAIAFFVRLPRVVWKIAFPIADAAVLGAWAATGTFKSLQVGVHWLPALGLGVCTAVGGGMIRDVAVGRVPEVFGGNTLYAIPAVMSASIVLAGHALGAPMAVMLVAATVVGASLAVAARVLGVSLPVHGDGTWSRFRRGLYGLMHRKSRSRDRAGRTKPERTPGGDSADGLGT